MARRAGLLQPGIRVLFTSGYTQNAIVHGGRLDPGVELLGKPYSRNALAYKLRQVLERGEDGRQQELSSVASPAITAAAEPADGKRVLVVQDDDASRAALCELLVMLGHHAEGVSTAGEAFASIENDAPDVLVTDVHLPDLSRIELARRAASLQPRLRIVFASGDVVTASDATSFQWTALRKPFTSAEPKAALKETQQRDADAAP